MLIWFIGTWFIWGNMAKNFKERWFNIVQYSLEDEYKDNLEELKKADIVFVAVPTPTKNRKFDRSVLENAIENTVPWQKIVIKSTILCWTTDYLQEKYPDRYFFHSAEFLTERNAKGDVDKPSRNVVWYTEISKPYAQDIMDILPEATNWNIFCTAKESEMWKYASNFLLTAKILMANLIYDLCEKYHINYENVKDIASKDDRIWPAHLNVVFEWWRWANWHCFPKDLAAFHEMYCNWVYEQKYGDWDILLESLERYNARLNISTNKQVDIIRYVLWEDFINNMMWEWEEY